MADGVRAIENLLHTYAELIDRGDFAGVGRLFAGGQIVVGPEDRPHRAVGAAEVEALYDSTTRRYPDDGTPHTHHVTTNLIVEVRGETATARSYFTVLQGTADLALQPIIAGRYHDRFALAEGRWAFAERKILVDRTGDLSHHLLIDL